MPKVEYDSEDIFNLSLALVGLILESGPMTLDELESYFQMPKKTILRAAKAIANSEDLYRYETHFYLDLDLLEEEGLVDFSVGQAALSSTPPLSRMQIAAIGTGLEYLASLPQFAGNKDLAELRSALGQGIEPVVKAEKHPLDQTLVTLREAIISQQRIIASYVNQLGEASSRKIDPLRIDFVGNRYYLRGFCNKSEELRSFRLDRIGDLVVTAEPIPESSLAAIIPEEIYGSNPGQFEVQIEAEPHAYEIFWNFPTSGEPKALSNGNYSGTIKMGNPGAIARHVVRYGGAVRVTGPAAARRAVANFAELALGHPQVLED